MINYDKEAILKFAQNAKNHGFKVYLSETEKYGILTDNKELRVLSFGCDLGMLKLSGNYKGGHASGSGWILCYEGDLSPTKERLQELLYASSSYPHNGYTNLKEYLNTYDKSSRFKKIS